ncbi:MAG: helix-turn-helix domain-containing protein [Actinomycetota bacterium]|nr:helix-turn-helix domain-containing protein [Actinomycetota bacterium]
MTIQDADRLMTARDLAEYLEVPLATVYSWRRRREGPPGFRVGRHLRYRWRDVERWVDSQLRNAKA